MVPCETTGLGCRRWSLSAVGYQFSYKHIKQKLWKLPVFRSKTKLELTEVVKRIVVLYLNSKTFPILLVTLMWCLFVSILFSSSHVPQKCIKLTLKISKSQAGKCPFIVGEKIWQVFRRLPFLSWWHHFFDRTVDAIIQKKSKCCTILFTNQFVFICWVFFMRKTNRSLRNIETGDNKKHETRRKRRMTQTWGEENRNLRKVVVFTMEYYGRGISIK